MPKSHCLLENKHKFFSVKIMSAYYFAGGMGSNLLY